MSRIPNTEKKTVPEYGSTSGRSCRIVLHRRRIPAEILRLVIDASPEPGSKTTAVLLPKVAAMSHEVSTAATAAMSHEVFTAAAAVEKTALIRGEVHGASAAVIIWPAHRSSHGSAHGTAHSVLAAVVGRPVGSLLHLFLLLDEPRLARNVGQLLLLFEQLADAGAGGGGRAASRTPALGGPLPRDRLVPARTAPKMFLRILLLLKKIGILHGKNPR
jgi:hypothetical protein